MSSAVGFSIKQVGDKMVSTNVFTPAALRAGDAVKVIYGDKVFFSTVIDVRMNTAPNPTNQNVVAIKGFPPSLYVGRDYKSTKGSFPCEILRVSNKVMTMDECMDAIDKLVDTDLF